MLRKIRKRPIRKRSFLLFELLLSISLLLLCLFPMIKTHVGLAREELKQVQKLNREQELRFVMCKLKEDLHNHCYSWEELMKGVEGANYTLTKRVQSTKIKTTESGLILEAILIVGNEEVQRFVYVEKTRPHAR